jgi:phosphoenolpyruvate carboxykinase (GTP)
MTGKDIVHPRLGAWIDEVAGLCSPASIHVCDGSHREYEGICDELLRSGTFTRLNPALKPGSYYALSDPGDVARVEDRTFICSKRREDAGPTNNWADPAGMKKTLTGLFKGSMRGRTMYVIPYSMGAVGGDNSKIGVEITDSAYVAANMAIMARVGAPVLKTLGSNGEFVRCLHSVGSPLAEGARDVAWPCDPDRKYIVHFPEERTIWSYGSGYGGNALLGKKCFALRIASVIARDEGWLAEHMLILGITDPEGRKRYVAAAFPSACGKTNLAMLVPTLPGWKVECLGDDIAWMRMGKDGRLYAMNPEAGFFGVAPGTSAVSNPNALAACSANSVFTNCALTPEGDVWWEGLSSAPPAGTKDWRGRVYDAARGEPAAHPNARFTAPARQCPVIDPAWESAEGVPISAILFGGRRATVLPLVHEARSWKHGVFMGSIVSSETTAAAAGQTGKLRRDPFAMLPFCGYNMGRYFAHWIGFGGRKGADLPRVFYVNWFRKGSDGRYLWPGYGDNSRVLKWVFERCEGRAGAAETPIGFVPRPADLDLSGLSLPKDSLESLLAVRKDEWLSEVESVRQHYQGFALDLPPELERELTDLEARLRA